MGSSNAHAVLNAALALHAQDNGLAPVHLVHLGARLQLVAEFVKGQEPGSPCLVQCLGSGLSLGFAVIEEVLVPLAKIITHAQLGVVHKVYAVLALVEQQLLQLLTLGFFFAHKIASSILSIWDFISLPSLVTVNVHFSV